MEAKARARYLRIAPRKAQAVIDLIRGKDVEEAQSILRMLPNKPAFLINKVLQSAKANAEHNYDMDVSNLYVAQAYVDEGPTLRRYRPRARGRATRIRKRTSHITIILNEKEEA
ncbi:MAG: 50S ribosomal protein L22 [Firmicutes bacterium]|nr:50S ribosomal protein L22 [Bacillota bacterium]